MSGPSATPSRPLRVGVLASGEGTNLQALLDTVHGHEAEVVALACDKPDARALIRAAGAGVPTRVFPRADHPTREDRDAAIAAWLGAEGVELVVLAGYMAILTPVFVGAFEGRIVNVHPSLLPAFPGIRAIEQAIAHGVEVFGVTVHLVDDGVDTGRILLQDAVRIPGAPDAAAVHDALRPLEHRLLPEAVRRAARGELLPAGDG
ncbi:phosphoribosylglycinamide formyltransferase [Patulibacter sp. NPDC049589]|uniref:phosphoribosylglycinamide formyltransferase n=1 Tax=Patulibacter sp. NPDC049589 TaxID=3154731 RepID=UPI00342D320D